LLRRGQQFANMSLSARMQIAELGHSFIQEGNTVLVHGASRVVTTLILRAAKSLHFNIIITEGRVGDEQK
jgi:translation initiation factor 2B subunit (eIF-2B alpha/beta/delta family)